MNATVLLLVFASSAVLAAVPGECHPATAPGLSNPNAEVYLVRWDKLTSSALSPSDVRKSFDVRAEVKEVGLLQQLRSAISQLECEVPALGRPRADARLVIDFRDETGRTETYFMDQNHLYDSGGRTCVVSVELRDALQLFEFGRSPTIRNGESANRDTMP